MTTRSTSRITFEHVNSPQFQGQSVRAVGKLVAMDDGHVQLVLAGSHEGGPVTTIVCPNGTHKYSPETMGKGHYEVIGQLQSGQIMEMTSVYMGDNFDMGMYADMVSLTHQFPDIF
ncbi:DNA replication factor a subunit ssb3 [Chrysochromulina tobinii]|uniref:DNA replication factor a subunit ssb3 n=1 Tax=Chrysochromulina tobinii TaxID=1460289 RepID=A0A0M0JT59_9EUKA|nr:DNA replication factor a subunit ssb3 [Chrysochromulina tobinii]|eukprot:KOO29784.1 DNA replication factor a subunit ssb3 [Chrysochromulina sp. CCMP291]